MNLNYILLTYDSCRYDVLRDAHTPILDSYCEILPAQTPACYTYAAHQSFFVGMLPYVNERRPLYNRFAMQLFGLEEFGDKTAAKSALQRLASDQNIVAALADLGYQTIGAGAMNWFKQATLKVGFQEFAFTGTDAEAQIRFVREKLEPSQPFFAFINFGETHAPFRYKGKAEPCPVKVASRNMEWPPVEVGPVGKDNPAYGHQVEAAEFLDRQLPSLFEGLPGETLVVLCGDHGECFGEDGFWGHGVNHPKVFEVPISIFRLDRLPLPLV